MQKQTAKKYAQQDKLDLWSVEALQLTFDTS